MFDARLIRMAPVAFRYALASFIAKWLNLVSFTVIVFTFGHLAAGVSGQVIDSVEILNSILVCVACVLAGCGMAFASSWFGSKASSACKIQARRKLYDALASKGPSYREHVSVAEASELMGSGIEQLESYMGRYVPQLFFSAVAPLTLFVCVAQLSLTSAAVLLVCVPLIPVSIIVFMRVARKIVGERWDSFVDLSAAYRDTIAGLKTLIAYRADDQARANTATKAEEFRQATMKLLRVQLNSVLLMDLFAYGGAAIGIVSAFIQFVSGALSFEAALVISLLALQFFMPMRTMGTYFHTALNARTALDSLFALLDSQEAEEGEQVVELLEESIVAKSLCYRYADGRCVLEDVDMRIGPRSFIGITGVSGSGKSTLARLLTGELLSYTGSLALFGTEMKDANAESVRKAITCVGSDEHVFEGTFRTNLMLGNSDAGDYELWNALAKCRLDDFVLDCGGLDAPVKENGSNLSGGQRQRLCLSRALLRDTPIYVFDEASSNIDAESEQLINEVIQRLAFDKTIIVISHRLSNLIWADEVYVLEGGKAAQRGPHAVLVAQEGPYRMLWAQQEHLESFAQEAKKQVMHAGQASEGMAVPEGMEDAIERMPTSIANVVLSSVKTARIRAVTTGEAVPKGHPAHIAIGAAERAAARNLNEEKFSGEEETGVADGQSDASSTQDDRTSTRSFFLTIAGLLRLASSARAVLWRSAASGAFGAACAIAVMGCAVLALAQWEGGASGLVGASAMVACGVLRGVFHYLERLNGHDGTFRTMAGIRDKVFDHMRRLAPAKLEVRGASDLLALLTSDIELLEGFYARALVPAVTAIAVGVVVTVIVYLQVPAAGVAFAIGYIVAAFVLPWALSRPLLESNRELRERSIGLMRFVNETLEGLSTVIASGDVDARRLELAGRMGALSADEKRMSRVMSLSELCFRALSLGTFIAVFSFASYACVAAEASLASLLVCSALSMAAFDFAQPVAALSSSLGHTFAAANRVLDFLDESPETSAVVEAADFAGCAGLRAEKVSFSREETAILQDVDLDITQGSAVCLSGKSGAGKSTLIKLFMRYWDPDKGRMLNSERDLRDIRTDDLRSSIAFMDQETYLFNATLRENLVLARRDASDEQLHQALHAAALDGLLARLPQGIDTMLDESSGLSSGERQRVGLARMFLADAPLLMLDEPTSNLDCLNEAAVLDSLAKKTQGKTVLMASHRFTAAAISDVLIEMEAGRMS